MKIEKVNDRQIRCTLSNRELEQRNLKLSEIAYGNEKVKALFNDMMKAASLQFGFEPNDMPLMIEITPLRDSAVILITKVEDPEELDVRFSRFSPVIQKEEGPIMGMIDSLADRLQIPDNADELEEILKKLENASAPAEFPKPAETSNKQLEKGQEDDRNRNSKETMKEYTCFFEFDRLNDIIKVCKYLVKSNSGQSYLYKNNTNGRYVLGISNIGTSNKDFLGVCNVVSEYGTFIKNNEFTRYHIKEHYEVLIEDGAIQKMGSSF